MSGKVDVYCVKNTTLYIYENRIDIEYLGSRLSEERLDKETAIETLCRLLNKQVEKSNFNTIFYNVLSVIPEIEGGSKQKLVLETCVKIVNI